MTNNDTTRASRPDPQASTQSIRIMADDFKEAMVPEFKEIVRRYKGGVITHDQAVAEIEAIREKYKQPML